MQNKNNQNEEENEITRVKIPRQNELVGVVEQRLGGNKMMVSCSDGKSRNCRVPGRLRRKLWLRPGDTVLIELWELDKNRGDVIFKYTKSQTNWLKNKRYLN